MQSFKHLQREKVHFGWNILNNISTIAYFKKMFYINLFLHSGISSIIPAVKIYLQYFCVCVFI